jgi:hypothetical protein
MSDTLKRTSDESGMHDFCKLEGVRLKLDPKVEDGRIRDGYYASKPGMPYGAFTLRGPCGADLTIMVGSAELLGIMGSRISVNQSPDSELDRDELCEEIMLSYVKRLFSGPDGLRGAVSCTGH